MNKIQSKKILHLAKFYEPHLGGVETHLREVNRVLIRAGHSVTVVTHRHNDRLPLEEDLFLQDEKTSTNLGKVRVIRIPVNDFELKFFKFFGEKQGSFLLSLPPFSFFNKLFFKIKMWTWITRWSKLFLEADIIQVHDVFWWVWPLYPLLYFKIFITFHGWEGQYPPKFSAQLHRRFNNLSAKGSLHIGHWIKQFYGDKPSIVSYGGVNQQGLLKVDFKNQFTKKIKKIVFIGRLVRENELREYLEVFKILQTKNKNLEIIFVGDGVLRNECESLGQVTGWVKNSQKYLLRADLVFANSYLSILEAQALGKVVCSLYSQPLKKAYLETFPGRKYLLVANKKNNLLKKILNFEKLNKLKREILAKKIAEFAQDQTWEKVVAEYQKMWFQN